MELRRLKHVVVLARLLSYTKAAQELCLTQSALTRSIQEMERRANVRLFDRDRAGVRLTPTGKTFAARAAALLREADDLDRMLRRSTTADVGEVSFGMGPLAAQALLPAVLPKTLETKSELRTHVRVRNVESLLPALIQEELEFIVCPEDAVPSSAPVKSVFLGWFPMSLLVRAGHPVFGRSKESGNPYAVLSPAPFKSLDSWPRYYRPYLAGPLHIVEDFGVAARVTELTDSIWLCSIYAATEEIRSGKLKEIAPPKDQKALRFRMMLYSLDRRSLSPAALMLKGMFQDRIAVLGKELS